MDAVRDPENVREWACDFENQIFWALAGNAQHLTLYAHTLPSRLSQ
jgi:hypothetical protein